MKFSQFGQKFSAECGILQLMDDLGHAMAGDDDVIMLGGGNPSRIPEIEARFREQMQSIMQTGRTFEDLVGNYAPPGGSPSFRAAVADFLNRECNWPVTERNIVLTNGSQTAFFYLFNMLAGQMEDGSQRKILLPLTPEYIGYTDAGINEDIFVSFRPDIEHLDGRQFKYRVNFDALEVTGDIGAICVSRPTNPTGNVLTDGEIARLHTLAKVHDIPLIIDNAYGAPFPGIQFAAATPMWDENIIYCLSLSKLGLPGARTGIIVADEPYVRAISGMNAIMSLAPGNFGAYMAENLMRTGDVLTLSDTVIRPHYRHKIEQAIEWLYEAFDGLETYFHKPEGTFFLWLWFKDMPITSADLYQRLKENGVIIVPGHYFFPGLEGGWRHRHECIRVNIGMEPDRVHEGIRRIGAEIRRLQT